MFLAQPHVSIDKACEKHGMYKRHVELPEGRCFCFLFSNIVGDMSQLSHTQEVGAGL